MTRQLRRGFSLIEMVAVVVILGIIAVIVVPRFAGGTDQAKRSACHANRGNIEVQCQLWFRQKSQWPLQDLSDIGQDVGYFPEGLPVCPVDGKPYQFDAQTQRIIGHDH